MGNSNTNLSRAICEFNVNKVNLLLATGRCSVGTNTAEKPAPIIECVSVGFGKEDHKRCAILRLLVQYGADLNVRCLTRSWVYGKTAAMIAAERGYFECLQFLVEAGADLNITNPSGDTALLLAVTWAQHECARILIDKMPNEMLNHKNETGENAFTVAASNPEFNYFLCLQYLVQARVDTDVTDKKGNTALMLSVSLEKEDRVKYLIENTSGLNRNINYKNNDGHTALMIAALKAEGEKCFLCLRLLLQAGADFCAKDKNGNTALMLAIKFNNFEAIKILEQKEASSRGQINF